MKDSLQSKACFERLHTYMPQFSKGTIELIVSYAKTGDMDKAVQLLKQAKGDKTLSPETAQLLCELHPDLKRAVEADR
jgi:pentatricopeptide repeat protein